jgi:hypothetical protein
MEFRREVRKVDEEHRHRLSDTDTKCEIKQQHKGEQRELFLKKPQPLDI